MLRSGSITFCCLPLSLFRVGLDYFFSKKYAREQY
jgi:hypothetical protein